MKDEIVSFETAQLAKEKGFLGSKSQCNNWYYHDGRLHHEFNINGYKGLKCWNNWDATQGIRWDAPTQTLLQRWLREIKGLHVELGLVDSPNDYWARVDNDNMTALETVWNNYPEEALKTYEEALELGLKEALKLLN